MSKVAVIGGGPAGMMAAVAAAEDGHDVTLWEKNEKLGKKLFITGKGRCNVTNDGDVEHLLRHVVRNHRFLYSAFYTFDSQRMMNFLEEEGLHLKTERGNRVFPASDHSSDVIRTMERAMRDRGVHIMLRENVSGILMENGECCGILSGSHQRIPFDAVIVATGGLSYPSTGSTGDGYRFAAEAGHRIEECLPCLVPFETKEDFPKRLQGLSLKNTGMKLMEGKKVLWEEQGELLFTHFGISGPLVLTASCYAAGRKGDLKVRLDLKPALSEKQLDERILRDFAERRNCQFKNSLGALLPAKMIPVVVELSGIQPDKVVNAVTREERRRLVRCLKEMEIHISGLRGFPEAIITRGGVSVKEVDPATMESKKISRLFFAGEVLDLDAMTGGYNLQIAWSTGYVAGMGISVKRDEVDYE